MNNACRCFLITFTCLPFIASADDAAFALGKDQTSHRAKLEDLQWTPFSITVIEAAQWEETPRWELADLEGEAPGLIVDPMGRTPNGAAMSLRGVASDETSAAFFPAVAVKVDDVYIGTHASQNQVLFDFDRVEIKRGPQGAFEGAPAIGGAIDIYRNQPTQEYAATTSATIGDRNRKRLAAMANVPIADRFATRVALTYQDGGDYVTNIGPDPAVNGRSENNEDRLTARAAFRWQQDDNLALRYTADITRDRADRPARANISTEADLVCDESEPFPNCSFDGQGRRPETADFLTTTQNFSNARNYDVDQHAFHIDFDYRGHHLKSVTAWRDTDEFSAYDIDGSYDDLYSSITAQSFDQFTQEVTATGQWSETIDYTAGLFYLDSDYELGREDFHILPALDAAGRILDVTPDASRTVDARQGTKLISFFAHADYQASPQWKLDAGIRWTDVEREFTDIVSRIGAGTAVPPAMLSGNVSSAEATGTLGATYRVDPEAMVYLRYNRSFRPVAFDDTANSVDGAGPFGEESVDGFEIGLKSEWFDDRLRLNAVTYQNMWRDKLERFTAPVASGRVESVLRNTARVEVRGHELEIEAVPFDFLRLRASVSHLNPDYKNYTVPDLAGGDPIDRSALTPTHAPTDMFAFSGVYTTGFRDGTLRFYASWRHTKEYTSNSIVPAARVSNFSMIDLSVDYVWQDWTFRLFSRNSNGKRFVTNVDRPVDSQVASLAPNTASTLPIATTGDLNEPEFTALQVIFVPPLGR